MKVYNRGALAIMFDVAGRFVIIEGRNSSLIIGSTEKITEIADSDWEHIKTKYSYLYELADGIIFANSKIENINAQAKEMANESLADDPIVPKKKGK